jgi:hypothetical protein
VGRTLDCRRLNFIREALGTGEIELDKVRGRFSLDICAAARPRYMEQVKRILLALKTISDANAELQHIRDELERQGVTAGSLAAATFDLGGTWNDRYGGRLVGYQKYIAEHFPELAAVAGQSNQNRAA